MKQTLLRDDPEHGALAAGTAARCDAEKHVVPAEDKAPSGPGAVFSSGIGETVQDRLRPASALGRGGRQLEDSATPFEITGTDPAPFISRAVKIPGLIENHVCGRKAAIGSVEAEEDILGPRAARYRRRYYLKDSAPIVFAAGSGRAVEDAVVEGQTAVGLSTVASLRACECVQHFIRPRAA